MSASFPRRSMLLGSLAALVFIAAVASIGTDIVHRAFGMTPAATPARSVAAAAPGDALRAVVRIDALRPDGFAATVLERIDDADYRPSATHLTVALSPATAMVMGTRRDLSAGAIVQVSGTLAPDRILAVRQIVILTGYVRLRG